MNIRKSQTKDQQSIIQLVKDGLREFDFVYSEETSESDLLNINNEYFENGGVFLVMENENDEIIATGAIKQIDQGVFKIRKMYVSKIYQGKGYGKAILVELLVFAQEAGARKVLLETSNRMKAAIGLYTSFGFEFSPENPLSPRCDLTMIKIISYD